MEVENMSNNHVQEDDDDVALPGFRFHPTDEELVGFYLRRKVEKKPISIQLIKQIDIYKYEPWDLPKSGNVGEKEWYFFCKRGRKYRNSIRPNRVTGSGFWKATGIDRPVYNSGRECIGLKKSLVYYRGSAGKGTKTDWMMHEFRLPAENDKSTKHLEAKSVAQEAEVWTLCRIFKRNGSYKKCVPDWRSVVAEKRNPIDTSSSSSSVDNKRPQDYVISFGSTTAGPTMNISHENKPNLSSHHYVHNNISSSNQMFMGQISSVYNQVPSSTPNSSFAQSTLAPDMVMTELLKRDWDELRSVLELAVDPLF